MVMFKGYRITRTFQDIRVRMITYTHTHTQNFGGIRCQTEEDHMTSTCPQLEVPQTRNATETVVGPAITHPPYESTVQSTTNGV